MHETDALDAIRSAARDFEDDLSSAKRKRLGQFFTGLPLGKLLAQLALDERCHTVIDPMAGHGDLLDAVADVAFGQGMCLERLDGVEVDEQTAAFCARRIDAVSAKGAAPKFRIVPGSAFDPAIAGTLSPDGYDLVITNPPYVRYQSQNGAGSSVDDVRRGLSAIVEARFSGEEQALWKTLVESYSGLADLSVPAWIFAALLTRPGGRLALVVPATWRSRDYADVIRYLTLRFFTMEFIVADTQPGWFSNALVRTHLVVAQRLPEEQSAVPLSRRAARGTARWLQISPEAANTNSLVGAAFPGSDPEAAFSKWAKAMPRPVAGIECRAFDLQGEWQMLSQRLKRKAWLLRIEGDSEALPLFASPLSRHSVALPEGLRNMLPTNLAPANLETLEDAGISVGQGLRTGCNRFFYVTECGSNAEDLVMVETSASFQNLRMRVPVEALRPVLHRQADLRAFERGQIPATRVLDLSLLVLPEDEPAVLRSREAYLKLKIAIPRVMPDELAAFVRNAALHAPDPKTPDRRIPELSAVRTNVRRAPEGNGIPRFWYMLPRLASRHLPALFTPRINHGSPCVAVNSLPLIVIDANFSTLWSSDERWTNFALYALFNSVWFRAGMEAAGTPFGGGALKLEATHIRQLPVPALSETERQRLDALGRELAGSTPEARRSIDALVLAAVFPSLARDADDVVAQYIETRIQAACAARQRTS